MSRRVPISGDIVDARDIENVWRYGYVTEVNDKNFIVVFFDTENKQSYRYYLFHEYMIEWKYPA